MTYLNAKKYISSAPDAKQETDTNILALLDAMGNPHRRIKYLRLAGSNGKTVCAEMLTSVMHAANYRVGCLRMPLRDEPRENVCIDKECLAMDEFSDLVAEVRSLSSNLSLTLTKAEILLAVAFLAFKNKNCNLYVIESDHFGEDPSRFLPAPFAAVICGTIPSHDTSAISRIRSYIRKGVQEIVSAPQNTEAHKVISETCYSVNCRLSIPSRTEIVCGRMTFVSTEFTYKGRPYSLGLCGDFQVYNAVLVLEVIDMLRRKGFNVPDEAVWSGFASVKIPAKFEVLSLSPVIIADSTHSPVAIETVCDSLAQFKQMTGNKIRLCLPAGDIVNNYLRALEARDYEVESIIISDADNEFTPPANAVVCKTPKSVAKAALCALTNDTVLLISGDHGFVIPVRYQILNSLYF